MFFSLQRGLIALTVSLVAIASAGAAEPTTSVPAAEDMPPGVLVEAPDSRRELLAKFQALNPGAREHVLNLPMNAYTNTEAAPGLKLRRLWVGASGTLVEIEGLPVAGSKASAVIRQDTFAIRHANGLSELQAVEGVSMVKDRRSGNALVVKPGEVMLALFGPVDDYHPMRVQHTPPTGQVFVYFDNIDPRFGERYRAAYQMAAAANATPEQMKDFLVEFAENDPDKKAQDIFLKLITAMRDQNTFEGYYNAYLLIQNPEDARKASQLVRNDEHRAKMEHVAVAALADKNRLVEFYFSLSPSRASGGEVSSKGYFASLLSFFSGKASVRSASKPLSGVLQAHLLPNRPIRLALADYVFKFSITASAPYSGSAKGFVVGGNGSDVWRTSSTVSVRMNASNPQARAEVNLGSMEVAYLDRGMAGGYTARWLTGDGALEVRLVSVELVN